MGSGPKQKLGDVRVGVTLLIGNVMTEWRTWGCVNKSPGITHVRK